MLRGLLRRAVMRYHIPMDSVWIEYNPNPRGRRTIDCAVRAVCAALGVDWDAAYAMIAARGYEDKTMMVGNGTWGSVLRRHGFRRAVIPNCCPDCYTAGDFCRDHPAGTYVLGFENHVATVINGRLYDAWDSSQEIPQYYWFKGGNGLW